MSRIEGGSKSQSNLLFKINDLPDSVTKIRDAAKKSLSDSSAAFSPRTQARIDTDRLKATARTFVALARADVGNDPAKMKAYVIDLLSRENFGMTKEHLPKFVDQLNQAVTDQTVVTPLKEAIQDLHTELQKSRDHVSLTPSEKNPKSIKTLLDEIRSACDLRLQESDETSDAKSLGAIYKFFKAVKLLMSWINSIFALPKKLKKNELASIKAAWTDLANDKNISHITEKAELHQQRNALILQLSLARKDDPNFFTRVYAKHINTLLNMVPMVEKDPKTIFQQVEKDFQEAMKMLESSKS